MRLLLPLCACPALLRRQKGVYALEWAFVFPVFFLLLYAVISYGLTFLVRESMQHAVEEGVRAALRYPVGIAQPDWNDRRQAAVTAAADRLNWLPVALRPVSNDVAFTVCPLSNTACNAETPLNPSLQCDVEQPCLVLMTYAIDNYPSKAMTPVIMDLLLPDQLKAFASILVDRRLL